MKPSRDGFVDFIDNPCVWACLAALVAAAILYRWWNRLGWERVTGKLAFATRDDPEDMSFLAAIYSVDGHIFAVPDGVPLGYGFGKIGEEVEIRYPRHNPAQGYVYHPWLFPALRAITLVVCCYVFWASWRL